MKKLTCKTVKEWRSWLRKNHKKEDRVLLIRYKRHTQKPSFNQSEAMNEAICFGWIDTTIKRIDEDRYAVTFVKRKKISKWSDNTLARAKEMIKLGKMSKFGLEMYKLGLEKPTHDHGIPKNPEMPFELKKELKKKDLLKKFEGLAPSYKRMYFRWILSGKRKETREKRIKQTLDMVKKNIKFGVAKKDI
jgi:uncharacterized protein YdeI (YjbR/CyaY-like superfamily)